MCGHTDIYTNGKCRTCDREAQGRYRKRQRIAWSLLEAVEARHLSAWDAVALIRRASPMTIQECVSDQLEENTRQRYEALGESE